MSRGLAKVFAILVATELVALAVVVAIVLHSDQRTEFPTSVPVATATGTRSSSVPVSVAFKVVGATRTAALSARGGEAQTTSTGSDSGFVSSRRSARTTAPSRAATPIAAPTP